MNDAPSSPPRPITSRASRRAWMEPRVRFWWMAAVALVVLGGAFAVEQLSAWAQLRELVTNGTPVTAKVIEIEGFTRPGRTFAPNSIVKIRYDVDGQSRESTGPLETRTLPVSVEDVVDIRVNPADPNQWTTRQEMIPIGHYLIGGALVLPVLLGGILATLVQRAIVMRAWKNNPAMEVKVVGMRQSPLAPRSRLLRCTPGRIGDLRIIDVYLPRAAGDVEVGDSLWVVPLKTKSSQALAVKAFEGNG